MFPIVKTDRFGCYDWFQCVFGIWEVGVKRWATLAGNIFEELFESIFVHIGLLIVGG